ncbi:MAG: alkaline phosphatase [Fimbriimonadales bacterium]|nr:alkaline phosphatase [Fimbriimonadales bacterium]
MAKFSRREVFGVGAAGLASLYLPSVALGSSQGSRGRPRNVIFCVSDGMSAGVPSMLDQFLSTVHGRPSFWRRLLQDGRSVQTVQETCSLSSLVTDSSAASSAWGSGRRIVNGQVNCFPDGTRLIPLYEVLKDRAKLATGLVTTATITHATPAGFAVSHPTRDEEAQIAEKYLSLGVDVLLGGGDRFFNSSSRADKRNLYAEFARAGYRVVRDRASMLALRPGRKVLGIFSSSHVPYEVDRRNRKELRDTVPSLAEMALKAIGMLQDSPNGFVLQVEAARVDHAAHSNDPAGILYDQLAFDEALEAIVGWADQRGDTLVVVTTDHGNSNPGLMGAGDEYFDSMAGLEKLAEAKASFTTLLAQVGTQPTPESVREAVREHLGIGLNAEEAELVSKAARRASDLQKVDLYSGASSALAMALGNHYHIGWSGPSHSSDWVPLLALGPGSRQFARGWMKNSSVFDALLELYGIRFQNPPQMSREEMLRHLGKRKEALRRAVREHWLA